MTETTRACGSCTQCCKVMTIDALDKPMGVWCERCTVGVGCQAYEIRPQACREFMCTWLRDESLPDEVRPDRSRVVLGSTSPTVITAFCEPDDALAWLQEPIYSVLKAKASDPDHPVIVTIRAGPRMWVIKPGAEEDLDLGEIDPRSIVQFHSLLGGGFKTVVLPPMGQGERQAWL